MRDFSLKTAGSVVADQQRLAQGCAAVCWLVGFAGRGANGGYESNRSGSGEAQPTFATMKEMGCI